MKKTIASKLMAFVMVLTLLFAAIPTASAATAIKTDQKVTIYLKCAKPGYTFEMFKVASLTSTTATPYKTEYTSLVDEIDTDVLSGDSSAALDALDALDTMPSTAVSQGTFTSTATTTAKTFSNLEQGIYYVRCTAYPAGVTSVQNSILALPYYNNGWVYTYPAIDLATKVTDDTPTTEKKITNSTKNNVNFTDVSLGDTVNFELKNSVAGSEQMKLTTYAVYDDMSAGLTLNKNSFAVYLANADGKKIADLTQNTDYKVNITSEAEGKNTTFNVALTPAYLAKSDFYASNVKYTIVTYTANLNKYAIKGATGNPNEDVKLEYGNSSNVNSVPGNTVYVYTYGIAITKTDEASKPLSGATFELYTTKADAEAQKNAIASGTSDTNGKVVFKNASGEEMKLQSGTYYTVETKAPTGYNLYGKVIDVEIPVTYNTVLTNDTWVQNAPADGTVTFTVKNTKPFFPNTGGFVSYIYVVGFAFLAISAFGVFATSRKRSTVKAEK